MNLRSQILLVTVLLAALPLVLVIRIIGTDVSGRFTAQDTARVEDLMRTVLEDLEEQNRNLAVLLDSMAENIRGDNDFRLAMSLDDAASRAFLADYAPRRMSLMRIGFLLIQDPQGRILSAGHFRGAYGNLEPDLPERLAHAPGGRALLPARSPEGDFMALARTRPVQLGGTTLDLSAGIAVDRDRLRQWGRSGDLALALIWPGGALATTEPLQRACARELPFAKIAFDLERQGNIVRGEPLPVLLDGQLQDAWLLVSYDQADLRGFLGDLQRRLAAVLVVAVAVSALLAIILAGRISKPLAELARRTQEMDLDRLDADFQSPRRDEVGHLTRLLGEMTARLRDGVTRLRAAEQKATLGEVARQVNHDIRNGITPLRNVLRHLGQVAQDDPDHLAEVFDQRRGHLEEGLSFLEELATHYARLSPRGSSRPCRLDTLIAESLAGLEAGPVALVNRVPANLPPLAADPVSLRRIFDNLLRNARESLPPEGGTITCDGALDEDPQLGEHRILVSVSDTGSGIPSESLDRIFEDFFTTKQEGTGLGLSNVRRLVGDLGGTIRVASEAGVGSTFTLSFPLPGRGDDHS